MNDTLTEIKNHLQGNNSRVDKAKNQINGLEHKEAKRKKKIRMTKKRESKKSAASGTISRGPTFTSYECQREKRNSKKLEICFKN